MLVVFGSLCNPKSDFLNGAVGKIWSALRHSASEWQTGREFGDEDARFRLSGDDCGPMISSRQELCNGRHGQSPASTMAGRTAKGLEDRPDVILK